MRTCYVMSAIPGAGKSTWAKQFQAEHENTFIVNSDAIRKELFGRPDDFSNEKLVWATFLKRLNEYGSKYENVNVIADSTNLTNYYRAFYRNNTPVFDRHVLVMLETPIEVARIQNTMRPKESIVPEYAMRRLLNEYEELDAATAALFDEVLHIKNFVASEAALKKAKSSL